MRVHSEGTRRSSHQLEVAAPPHLLYDLVADAAVAPLVFPGTIHVEWLDRAPAEETIRIWALNGPTARRWTSRRRLDPAALSVTFRQETPEPPVAFMQGRWRMTPVSSERTLVTLGHTFRAVDDDTDGLAWIEGLVERVSRGQLEALRDFTARGRPRVTAETADLGCPVDVAYALAEDCGAWVAPDGPVRSAVTRWPFPDLQVVDLEVTGPDHGPRSYQLARVCCRGSHIAVKDMLPAPPVTARIGSLRFSPTATGTRVELSELVTSSHDEDPGASAVTGALLAALKALR